MIQNITINNFQSHERTELDLVSGVNVVVGKSNSGKTAIIRALNWLVNNRPRGFRFHSDFAGKKPTVCEIVLQEGIVVQLYKEKEGTYFIGQVDSPTPSIYSGLGAEVPDQIVQALNISELNFSEQLEAPFLITASAGEVGKVINQITKLERVDEWVSELTTDINSLNKSIEVSENELTSTKQKLEALQFIEELEVKVNKLQERQLFINKILGSADKLKELIDNLVVYSEEIKILDDWLRVEESFSALEKRYQQRTKNVNEALVLNSAILVNDQYQKWSYFASAENQFLPLEEENFGLANKKMEQKDLDTILQNIGLCKSSIANQEIFLECEKDFNSLQTKAASLAQLMEQDNKLSFIGYELKKIGPPADIQPLIKEYEKELRSIGKCPICSSDITEEHIQRIMEEL